MNSKQRKREKIFREEEREEDIERGRERERDIEIERIENKRERKLEETVLLTFLF